LDTNLVVEAEEYSSLQSLQYTKTSGFRPRTSHQIPPSVWVVAWDDRRRGKPL